MVCEGRRKESGGSIGGSRELDSKIKDLKLQFIEGHVSCEGQ